MKKALLSLTILLSFFACLFVSCEPKASSVDVPTVSVMEIAGNNFTFRIALPSGARAEWESRREGSSWTSVVPVRSAGENERIALVSGITELRVRSVMPDGSASEWLHMDPFRMNMAPSAPEVTVYQAGSTLRFVPSSVDPEGDEITFEIQVNSGASWKPVPDYDGWTAFVSDKIYDFRARAVDAYGNASAWAPFSHHMYPGHSVRFAYFGINGWNKEGQARVIVIGSYDGPEDDILKLYIRKAGETGPGKLIRGGFPLIDLGLEDAEAHGVMLEPGYHEFELRVSNGDLVDPTGWYPLRITVHAPEKVALIRPVIFRIDSEEYIRAVRVVTDTGLTVAEMKEIERRYGSDPSYALMKDLGYDLSIFRDDLERFPEPEPGSADHKLYFDDYDYANPIWSYIDDENVLHIATTAEVIMPVKSHRAMFDSYDSGPYPGQHMFLNMDSLIEADLTGFDFASTSDLDYMFNNCHSLERVIWDKGTFFNIMQTHSMFMNCYSLKEDPFPHEGTFHTYMSRMYSGCKSLESVDMSGLHPMRAPTMEMMFAGCSNLKSVRLPEPQVPVSQMHSAFADCESLTSVDLTGLEFADGIDMNHMFSGMTDLREIKWDFAVRPISLMNAFRGCSSLETLDLSRMNLLDANGNTCRFMMGAFQDCSKLKDGYIDEDGSIKGLWLNETFEQSSNGPGEYDTVNGTDMFRGSLISDEFAAVYTDGKVLDMPRPADEYPIWTDLDIDAGLEENYRTVRDLYRKITATLESIDPVLL